MGTRDWEGVLFMDFSPMREITDESVEKMVRYSKGYRSSVRVATGRVYTARGYEARKKRALRPLPE